MAVSRKALRARAVARHGGGVALSSRGRCSLCGQPVYQPVGPGRIRERHPECGELHRALRRVEQRIADVHELYGLTPARAAMLAGVLFDLRNAVPRPRDASGRFVRGAL